MQIGYRRLGGGDEVSFAECFRVLPFLNGIGLIKKLGKLPHPFHAFSLYHEWRADLGIAMLVHVQIQQELDHRPLQTRPPAGVQQKAAPSQFSAALKVDQLQRIT